MNENIQLEMNPSVKKHLPIATSIALFSQDIDNYSFDITFTDLELQAGDQVEVLAKLQGGKLEHKSSATLVEVDGELIARYVFDTKLIDSEGHVFCYVYLKRGDKSADVGAFYFETDLSELDKVGGKIAEVYDGRYEDLVAGFEIKLQEYRDSLPQASEVRAEVDVILNQFGVDSQAKLNQYDTDAQQVIADNQTAFGLAETGRQNTYEQAENARNQSSNQVVVDWTQDADALLETVEGNESARVDAEATRETAETDRVSSESTRKTNETTRISNEDERKSAEVIRLASEVDRVNAEDVRKGFYEGFESELGKKANKQQEDWITPTLLNGWHYGSKSYDIPQYKKDELGRVHVKGFLQGGTDTAFTFPVGYRPTRHTYFTLQTSTPSVRTSAMIYFSTGSLTITGDTSRPSDITISFNTD